MVGTTPVVGTGMVGGTNTVVVGLLITLVGGARVVVVSGGASVVAVVVATGGWVVPGATVPLLRETVVATGAWVGTGEPAMVVVVSPTMDEVGDVEEVGSPDVVVARSVVLGPVVDVDWLAICCLGLASSPVVTSNRRAANAIDARAYSPTLKR